MSQWRRGATGFGMKLEIRYISILRKMCHVAIAKHVHGYCNGETVGFVVFDYIIC